MEWNINKIDIKKIHFKFSNCCLSEVPSAHFVDIQNDDLELKNLERKPIKKSRGPKRAHSDWPLHRTFILTTTRSTPWRTTWSPISRPGPEELTSPRMKRSNPPNQVFFDSIPSSATSPSRYVKHKITWWFSLIDFLSGFKLHQYY